MKLRDILEKLADLVEIRVIVDDYGTIYGAYAERDHINEYQNCTVERIDTTDNGILIIIVDGNTED